MAAEEQGGGMPSAPAMAREGALDSHTDIKTSGKSWVRAMPWLEGAVHAVLHDRAPVVGVDITPGHIRLCKMQQHDDRWELKKLAAAAIGQDQTLHDVQEHEAIYVEKLKAMLAEHGIKTRYAAIALPVNSSIIRTITTANMADEDIEKAIAMGTFWQSIVQLSAKLSEYSIYYEILGRNLEDGTMDLLFAAARNRDIALYTGILRKAGLIPVVADVQCFALQNAFRLNREDVDGGAPTVLLRFGAEENYILLEDRGRPYLYEIYIPDTEREAIATQLQNPEFVQRFSVQVKQMLVKHGAKHEGFADPKRIRVVSLLPELEPFVQAMSTTLQDYTVTLWNPFRHVEVPSALAAQVEREGNPTAWAVPMGLAVRSLTIVDWFHHAEREHTDHVNLLPEAKEFIHAQRIGLFSRLGISVYTAIALAVGVVMTVMLFGQVHSVNSELRGLHTIEKDHAAKLAEVTVLRNRVGQLTKLDRIRGGLPANQDILLKVYQQSAAVIPEGVWLNKLQFSPPAAMEMTGRALDDAGILEFIRGLDASGQFAKVTLKTMQAEKEDKGEVVTTTKTFAIQADVAELQAIEDEKARRAAEAKAAEAQKSAKPAEPIRVPKK